MCTSVYKFVFFVLFFTIILTENRIYSNKIRNKVKANPWKDYMAIYDIARNHGSGVRQDLGGIATGPETNNMYRYPRGKCPVFGKVLTIQNKIALKHVQIKDLNRTIFLRDALTGNIGGTSVDEIIQPVGLVFPQDNIKDDLYINWKSPVKKENILKCAKYADTMEHLIQPAQNNINCVLNNNKGTCIKQPFIYDLKNKDCYILYPLMQTKSVKINESMYVFGTYNIRSDWKKACPIKTIRGARFGKWENGKCKNIRDAGPNIDEDLYNCGFKLFQHSPFDSDKVNSTGQGTNWGVYSNSTGCIFYDKTPDCFINDESAYSFTSTGMVNLDIYDIPPCIHASENWTVEANCNNDNTDRKYTCINGKWRRDDGVEITKCISKYDWSNIDEEENEEKVEKVEKEKKNEKSAKVTHKTTQSSATGSTSVFSFILSIIFLVMGTIFV